MTKKYCLAIAAIIAGTSGMSSFPAHSQTTQQKIVPELVQRAQTVHIPLTAVDRQTVTAIRNLTESDFSLDIDGQPRPFQLSKPWENTVNTNTGDAQDLPYLLIVLPLGVPLDRKQVLNRAIADLSRQPHLNWNI